ncbi:MAG: DUF2007 domain-containing protein [Pseudomonadota bacterium]
MTDDKLILLARFDFPTTAHIAKTILESHNVPCYVFDAMHSGMNWDINGATRLMVLQSDEDKARQLLKDEDINFE